MFSLWKGFEQFLYLLHGHAYAVVPNLCDDLGLALTQTPRDDVVMHRAVNLNGATALKLDCIWKNIDQNLLESALVELNFTVDSLVNVSFDLELNVFDGHFDKSYGFVDCFADFSNLVLGREDPLFDEALI